MRLSVWRIPFLRRLVRDERGQNIALAGLLFLFVFLAVMLTFSIGNRTREKIKLQALADSGAYSIAVAEARLFNYYAWSNRARVAHDVAILSIHSHASYITYMESLFKASHDALDIVKWEMRAYCIACAASGSCCMSCKNSGKFGKAADEYWGDKFWQGKWLHDKWHDSNTYDKMLMGAAKLHEGAIYALRQEQRTMQVKLGYAFTQMPQKAAQVVDPDIKQGLGAAAASAKTLNDAISWGPGEDWKEIVSATRHSAWIYKRSFKAGGAWGTTFAQASAKLIPCFHIPYPTDNGNAKTTQASGSFGALQGNIHKGGDDDQGWGKSRGYGAEDHGSINMFGMCDCPGYGRGTAKGGVISGPRQDDIGTHFYFHAGREQRQKETDDHHMGGCGTDGECGVYAVHPRYTYGEQDFEENKVWGHPHPVVVLTKDTSRMVDPATGEKYPFDFDMQLELPVPVSFRTLGNEGDTQAGNKMAAIAGALVYYHKPGGDAWQEPPSFWNPFWRAKLHPLKGPNGGVDSRGAVLGIDHTKSAVPANAFISY